MPEELKTPRIFISYSWSGEDYKNWVFNLATELTENGIDVELDRWSLREGENKFVYMERMVTDPTIDKVIILCDKMYKEKADGREGGVGTETTIMTPEVYKSVKAEAGAQKFIPVITERDPETKQEFVPAFLDGKTYIDMSDSNHYTERFEQLVRVIHNKPSLTKPKPGKMPQYLLEEDRINLGTSARFRRAMPLVKEEKPQALNAVKDYFSVFAENLKEYDILSNNISYDQIIERLKEMLPARDEVLDLIEAISRYSSEPRMYEEIHAFFESLIPYFEPRKFNESYNQWSSEHYKFFIHELFLYTIALLLKNKRFVEINELIGQGFYQSDNRYSGERGGLTTFCIFDTYSEALNNYNSNLQSSYYSIYAKFLSDRATRSNISFDDIAQADFFLYLRDKLQADTETSWRLSWFPDSLLHLRYFNRSFEIFSRAQSKIFFEKLSVAFGGVTKEQIEKIIAELKEKGNSYSRSEIRAESVAMLSGIEKIATRP